MSTEPTDQQTWAPLIDVSDASINELLAGDDANPAFARSVARLLRDLNDPNGIISAFSAFAS